MSRKTKINLLLNLESDVTFLTNFEKFKINNLFSPFIYLHVIAQNLLAKKPVINSNNKPTNNNLIPPK